MRFSVDRLVLVLASGAVSSAACAQFAPPPPKESRIEEVEYVAPPPPPEPVERPQTNQPPRGPAGQRVEGPPLLPEIPWEGIVERDESGAPVLQTTSIHMLALKHNPLVGEQTLEKIREPVLEWVKTLDDLTLDNFDLALQVDGGFFRTLDFGVQQDIMTANEIRMALFPRPTFLNNTLIKDELLTKAQADFNTWMIKEYHRAHTFWIGEQVEKEFQRMAEERGEPLSEEEQQEMRKTFATRGAAYTFGAMCQDAVWSARRQLLVAADHFDEIVESLELEDELATKAEQASASLKAAQSEEERYQVMRDLAEAMIAVDFYFLEEMLLSARDIAGEDYLPELDMIVEKPTGEPPREDIMDWRPGDKID